MINMSIFLIIVAGLLLTYIFLTYNKFISLRNMVENAWAQVDVQLRRRYDLVENLVETVKGYAVHERETLSKVIDARARAIAARTPLEQGQAENVLTSTLKTLFAVAENYPQLKANENFMQLQRDLTEIENKIAFAREFYNDMVLRYEVLRERFPSNIVASLFAFPEKQYFEIEAGEARQPTKVKF
ncbi:MAG: LemA family protein [Candidatus Sumerlaeia bacterium]|nr:LemA family protein [Candidatus Sumerlaeia bacterium]